MSLQTQLHSLVLRLAQEFNKVQQRTGSLADLNTADKSSLVAAINELLGSATTALGIDDDNLSATSTFSSNKIVTLLDELKSSLLGGADEAFDTLLELQQALQNDQSGLAAVLAALDHRLRVDEAQTLTPEEQAIARSNIGAAAVEDLGDTTVDWVAVFEAELN